MTKITSKTETTIEREISYNFTSASDKQIVMMMLGDAGWQCLEELWSQRITGRSARLVMRFIGDLFILTRNPFIYEELVRSKVQRHKFFKNTTNDLNIIEQVTSAYRGADKRDYKVRELLDLCRNRLDSLHKRLKAEPARRASFLREFGAIIGKENVSFDPFTLIAHATDATDWRLYLPLAVLRPSREEDVPKLLEAAHHLGVSVIARGGGTGLTGGAVPLTDGCIVVNSEKLTHISRIEKRAFPHLSEGKEVAVLKVESGVVTSNAMAVAKKENLVFATDPTSSWACTIGGNIAENAGGKTAVLWGTAIDNALAWTIAMPHQGLLRVVRREHLMRKILPDDTVYFDLFAEDGTLLKTITLQGDQIRKRGLGKDITNKALGGLPGFQKEGTDGIITSAEFVLYPSYAEKITFCLEFYGDDLDEASEVIVEISNRFKNEGKEAIIALEHFDAEYIKAINYKFKAARKESPKAVLLIDLVGHNKDEVARGRSRLSDLLAAYPNTETFIAQSETEGERFWRDRKRFGAIAARTNAFKLNEDIVLPLHTLAEFTRFVDERNVAEDIYNKQQGITKILEYLKKAEPLEDPEWLAAKIPAAEKLCKQACLDVAENRGDGVRQDIFVRQLIKDLLKLFRGYSKVSAEIEQVFSNMRARRIVIATHMHAGDGNNHVNIPVFSNDEEMMSRATSTADAIMHKAIALGGVVSGEHGIGITKIKFLEKESLAELTAYRKEVDPDGLMSPGALCNPNIIEEVFTPSFNLLELEARILQHSSLAELSNKIASCVRCGKCMPDCCVYHPGSNLFFHPRNKNLVIGALIEALLYDSQRSHLPKFRLLRYLEEVADHCTMCGKCLPPCPVDIDTARISILEREILAEQGYKHTALPTWLSLIYLKSRNRFVNFIFRKSVLQAGTAAQQLAVKIFDKAPSVVRKVKRGPLALLEAPMTQPAAKPLHSFLPRWGDNQALVLPPMGEIKKTVFYFPGCGSERLYSQIGCASIYLLLKHGVRVVLPPRNLCCGFPIKSNAKRKKAAEVSLRNSIILTQIREMLGHIDFASVLVSCGTCREALHEIGVENIFESGLRDISDFILTECSLLNWRDTVSGERKNPFSTISTGTILYHTPCHDSFKGKGVSSLQSLYQEVIPVGNCCSEAGTLALSRPDIAGAMRYRKKEQLEKALEGQEGKKMVIATNCPSCITGLGKNRKLGYNTKHIAEILAERLAASECSDNGTFCCGDWLQSFEDITAGAKAITF